MVKIKNVIKNSPAHRARIKSGEFLVMIGENEIYDVLDYMFYTAEKDPRLTLRDREVTVKKDEYEDLGLEFDSFLMSEERKCANKCIFCFIDQLPHETPSGRPLRSTLYFKDDDSRLSFLQGNYISLTNLTERETKRIINMKLGVNVSVHTTDKSLRVKMLGNPRAGDALEHLFKIAEGGSPLNCQVVICPGINDGAALNQTLSELCALNVNSVACVPVGLTKHRESRNLTPLTPFTKETARAVLDIIEKYDDVYASDELYIIAERDLPDFEHYCDFPQYENGVGMIKLLEQEFIERLNSKRDAPKPASIPKKSLATGVSAAPFIEKLIKMSDANVQVYAIENNFFGNSVTVAGLVSGSDLINQLAPHKNELGKELLIPVSMLRAGGDVFLDDVTVNDVKAALGIDVRVVKVDGAELYEALF
ncbi:MAG: DUF512 domain-containing protein [Oscillospiraceae bacterium]|nr:DUF512 domain-containing protein [Oscillospiraceae bacterium]